MTATSATPSTPPSTPTESSGGRLSGLRLSTLRDYGIVVFLIALIIALWISTDTFMTTNNIKNVIDGAVAVGLIACAGTIVIMAGGFDLSAGAIFAVSAIIGVKVSNEASVVVGVLVGIVVGCGLGLINGLLTTVGRINHFVATLGTMIAFGGMAVAISGSGLILVNDPSFANIANTDVLGFHLSSWILVAVALFCGFLLNWTVFGRHVFGAGGNLAAARLSGVPINRTLIACYVLSGGVAAAAGLIVAARSLSVSATTGANLIFDALAAILIGGNSVFGGEGAIWRTMIGVAILAVISNGFNLLGVDPLYQQIVSGTLIIVAVGLDAWVRRRA
jgi:ribose transport system permease protein